MKRSELDSLKIRAYPLW